MLTNTVALSPEHLVLHICNNRKCYNPKHLKLGTASDNMVQSYVDTPYSERKVNRSRNQINLAGKDSAQCIEAIKAACCINSNDCWVFPVTRTERYGMIVVSQKICRVPRLMLSYKLSKNYDEINITRHLCHDKSCCNPEHLAEGDESQNMLDSRATNPNNLLTEENVEEILTFCISEGAQKIQGTELDRIFSEKFDVSPRTIQSIRAGTSWNDVHTQIITSQNMHLIKKRILTKEQSNEVIVFSLSDEGQKMRGKDIDKLFSDKFNVSTSTITGIRDRAKHRLGSSALVKRKKTLAEKNAEEILLFSLSDAAQKMSGNEIDRLFSTKFFVSPGVIANVRAGRSWSKLFNSLVTDQNKHRLKKRGNEELGQL